MQIYSRIYRHYSKDHKCIAAGMDEEQSPTPLSIDISVQTQTSTSTPQLSGVI